jgi:hypothetical protein
MMQVNHTTAALMLLPPVAAVLIQLSRFESNAAGHGGAIAVYQIQSPAVQIQDCDFVDNKAAGGTGGALYTDHAAVNLSNSNITRSNSTRGGAIFLRNASMLNMSGVRLVDNYADVIGGALAATGEQESQPSGQCCTRTAYCRYSLALCNITIICPAVTGALLSQAVCDEPQSCQLWHSHQKQCVRFMSSHLIMAQIVPFSYWIHSMASRTAKGHSSIGQTPPQNMMTCMCSVKQAFPHFLHPTSHISACCLVLLAVVRMHATILRNNTAKKQGGAVGMLAATRLQASDCIFEVNTAFDNATTQTAGSGGALYVNYTASVTLSNCTFGNNTCLRTTFDGVTRGGKGGAIAIYNEAAGKGHN